MPPTVVELQGHRVPWRLLGGADVEPLGTVGGGDGGGVGLPALAGMSGLNGNVNGDSSGFGLKSGYGVGSG